MTRFLLVILAPLLCLLLNTPFTYSALPFIESNVGEKRLSAADNPDIILAELLTNPYFKAWYEKQEDIKRGYPIIKRGYPLIKKGYPVLKRGYPVLKRGYPVLKRGYPVLKRGYPVLKRGYPVLKRGYPVLKRGYPVLKRGYPVLKRGYPVLKRGYPVLKRGYPVLKRGYPLLKRSTNEYEQSADSRQLISDTKDWAKAGGLLNQDKVGCSEKELFDDLDTNREGWLDEMQRRLQVCLKQLGSAEDKVDKPVEENLDDAEEGNVSPASQS